MPAFTVEWSSFAKLPCATCVPSDVIVCTRFDDAPTFNATLIGFRTDVGQKSRVGCNPVYVYKLSYINDDLGFTPYTCQDITGVLCPGCLTRWVTQQITTAVAAAVATLTDEFTQVLTSIFQAIEAAKTLTVSDSVALDQFSFLADPSVTKDLDLSITNPSANRPMRLIVAYGWGMNVVSGDSFGSVSINGQLRADGVDIVGEFGSAQTLSALSGFPAQQQFAAPGGVYNQYLLAPGASVTFTLHLSAAVGSPAPDNTFSATSMYVAVFGATEPA